MSGKEPSHALVEFEITRILEEAAGLESAAAPLLKTLCEGFGWDLAELWLLDEDAALFRRAAAWQPDGQSCEFEVMARGMAIPRDGWFVGRIVTAGRAEWVTDISDAPALIRREQAIEAGFSSILGFPLTDGQGANGVILLLSRERKEPDSQAASALQRLGRRIGEFVQKEQALQRSGTFYRGLVENQCDIVAVIGLDGVIRYESDAVTDVLGYSRRERIGRNAYEYVHPDDLPTALLSVRSALEHLGVPQTLRVRSRHKDGSWRLLESVGKIVVDATAGHVALVVSRDITSRVEAGDAKEAGPGLTAGETRILRLVADGMTNRQIAEVLSLSPHTVKDHLGTAMRKLGARNRAQAVQAASKSGLI